MKHLVIAVSADSSLELLGSYADIIVLDKELIPSSMKHYETLYIRSHFGQQALLPQMFRHEIELIVRLAKQKNPDIKFIDGADTVDKILAFEDKWLQFNTFGGFMPKTKLLFNTLDASGFERPIMKKRLSSRGNGVTWDVNKVTNPLNDWIMQESLDINEELRVYVIRGNVYPIGAVRQSMTIVQRAQAVSSRNLTQDEIAFSFKVGSNAKGMDIVGLDIARTAGGELRLMEVNRSPGFAAFSKLTGINIASLLYEEAS